MQLWLIYHKHSSGNNRWLFDESHMNILEAVTRDTFGFHELLNPLPNVIWGTLKGVPCPFHQCQPGFLVQWQVKDRALKDLPNLQMGVLNCLELPISTSHSPTQSCGLPVDSHLTPCSGTKEEKQGHFNQILWDYLSHVRHILDMFLPYSVTLAIYGDVHMICYNWQLECSGSCC